MNKSSVTYVITKSEWFFFLNLNVQLKLKLHHFTNKSVLQVNLLAQFQQQLSESEILFRFICYWIRLFFLIERK